MEQKGHNTKQSGQYVTRKRAIMHVSSNLLLYGYVEVIPAALRGLRNFQVAKHCFNKYVHSTGWSVAHNEELKRRNSKKLVGLTFIDELCKVNL